MKKHLVVTVIFNLFVAASFAQIPQPKPAFWEDVQVIKKYDSMFAPPAHPVLFIGSSSIRKWDDAQWTFAEYNALNRGIGGAVTNDIIYYLNDIVFKYQPKQIAIYVGENDLMDKVSTADSVYNRTMKLYQAIRLKMPDVSILYIGMKPSPSREKIMPQEIEFNSRIKTFLATEKNAVFIDVYPLMLDNGKLRPELYLSDKLHMTKLGYAIWESAIKPYLIK
ncbi:GDSL-type esterase/lipase family protein [Mucilaginibacter sp. UR6-11]|uniref:GDSL-type esterase/lipase family protein n=1 Tax=Mucilaginibacter sp. UR6-11 TaxID=1435644 RepID=UPI001E2BE522|nr:GDSL-type esterase/lipase family protein [Mucilaginibacter sp. UR6-11]MCC8425830.1 GDSL-type esterase/lipase family protein [Mucilaginibacter sp. UR6-11]